ncbi:MAG: hypothetical protein WCK31_05305, partial [bacterium]
MPKNYLKFFRQYWTRIVGSLVFVLLFSAYIPTFAIGQAYNAGETLDPACAPGEVNCTVTSISNVDSFGNLTLTSSGGVVNVGSSTGNIDNELRIYGYTSDNKYLSLTHTGTDALIETSSGTGWLRIGNEATDLTGGVLLFGNSTTGENREFRVYGYNTASALANYGALKYDDTYDALVIKTDVGHIQIGDAGSTTLSSPTNDDLFVSGRMETKGNGYFGGNII